MRCKSIKVGISFLLTLSLALMPSTLAYSKTITVYAQSQAIIGTTTSDLQTMTTGKYDDVKKLAEKKATVLTSIYGVTSIQYALIDNGKIVVSGQAGVYSKENPTTLTNNHMYGIGSVSKIFPTVAVLQLVQQGKVKLDTPVVEYVPEFIMEDARYTDITVRMLLNHSSGLLGSTYNNTMLFDDNDTIGYKNLLQTLKTQRLKSDPGEFSVYCNDGFTLAQILVEKVSGISFSEYIKNYISTPLGMNNTKTPMDDFQKDNLVKTYVSGSKVTLPIESLSVIGAGGIYSCAEDLCRLAEIFTDNSTSDVLTTASAKDMENKEYLAGLWSQEGDSSLSYGLGWDSVMTYPFTQYGIRALVKGGDTSLYHASIIVLPEEDMAMVVLSSGGASTYNQLMAQEVLLSALESKGSIDEIYANKTFKNPIQVLMPSSYKEKEGLYANSGGVMKVVISDDGILSLSNSLVPDSGTQKFIYTGDGKFYYSDGSTYLSFIEESNGASYLYVAGYSVLPSIGQLAAAGYQAQKITDNEISKKVKAVWEQRNNKKYFIINEKYSSQIYPLGSLAKNISILTELEGYCLNATIIDENTAKTLIQIPGMYGRDLNDYSFYRIGETEYLKNSGYLLISEDAVKSLSTKATFTCKINSFGDAHWYKISKKSENKKIKVTLPKNSSFTVYNAKDTCIYNSLINGKSTVILPSGGYIVFAGSANATFTVKYVK